MILWTCSNVVDACPDQAESIFGGFKVEEVLRDFEKTYAINRELHRETYEVQIKFAS